MACQTPLPLSDTLASEMTLFALDESLCLLMESAIETAAENNGEIPDELRHADRREPRDDHLAQLAGPDTLDHEQVDAASVPA